MEIITSNNSKPFYPERSNNSNYIKHYKTAINSNNSCYVHLDTLTRFLREETNGYFYTKDFVEQALSINKLITYKVIYI
ncbi:hypothetical protein MOUN0_M05820 [Monosporozyma unispora]